MTPAVVCITLTRPPEPTKATSPERFVIVLVGVPLTTRTAPERATLKSDTRSWNVALMDATACVTVTS